MTKSLNICCEKRNVVINNNNTYSEVAIDKDQNVPYDVLLTKIDVTKGRWGLYNFYKMQVD